MSVRFSHVWETAPRDDEDQENFLNAVAALETEESPEELKATLEEIEQALGKNPPRPKGPRTIDLDLLLYDDRTLKTDELEIPHPRMHERRFVLEPLSNVLEPQSEHPLLHTSWTDLLQKTLDQECTVTDMEL